MSKVVTLAILGAGGRGNIVSEWAERNPHLVKVVAVADPDAQKRERIVRRHGLSEEAVFDSYEELLEQPRLADAVCNMLMDRLHLPAALLVLDKGYHMLLEKPMATSLEECQKIERAAVRAGTVVSICHSMRYSPVYAEIKRLLDSGVIGELVSFDQLEAVDPRHQSHSFVRGNWGNESRSSFMLLTKSCHDMDILAWLVDKPCRQVNSFGSLTYFRKENCPPGAPRRCVDGCRHEPGCMYSAVKLYVTPNKWWYADHAGTQNIPFAEAMEIMKTSPYGRCVYQCDNDVVDHQVVSFQFDGGVTGTFTMTAFAVPCGRSLRLHGTEGCIRMEGQSIELMRYQDEAVVKTVIPPTQGGHGGADDICYGNFAHAVARNDPSAVLTSPTESLATHRIAFAAERSRREGRMVSLDSVVERPMPVIHRSALGMSLSSRRTDPVAS